MSVEITDSSFEAEVLKSDALVLVDFWAPWCGPCRVMGPILDSLAEDLAGQPIKIGKLNVDDSQIAPGQYGVMSIPNLMFFRNGQPVAQMVGVQTKDALIEKIRELM